MVRRQFTLLVTARAWWDDRAGTDVTCGPGCYRCPRLISVRGNANGCLDKKLKKCLMGSADELSSLRACTHCLHVGIRISAPLQRSLVREPSDVSSIAG